jgi:hypothetical protein
VRRIVAIFVKKGEVCEWSPKKGAWQTLDPEEMFSDPTLARPLRVKELLDAAEADNAVARALVAKHNAVIEAARAESRKEGQINGKAAAVLAVLESRGIAASAKERARILACSDDASLNRWLAKIVTVQSAEELLAGG